MNPNDPAFPVEWKDIQPHTGEQVTRSQDAGLTRREYFAIRFAAALLHDAANDDILDWDEYAKDCTKAAVKMADKLCAELSRKEV